MHLTASKRPGYSCSHWLIAFFADTSSCGKHVDMQAAEHLFDQVVVPSLVRVSICLASGPLQLSLQDIRGRGRKKPTVLICFLMPLIPSALVHSCILLLHINLNKLHINSMALVHVLSLNVQSPSSLWVMMVCCLWSSLRRKWLWVGIYCSATIMPNFYYLSVGNNC